MCHVYMYMYIMMMSMYMLAYAVDLVNDLPPSEIYNKPVKTKNISHATLQNPEYFYT